MKASSQSQGFVGLLVVLALTMGPPLVLQPVRAADYTVTNTNDSGAGSLRQAIINANNHPGPDDITFDLSDTDPGYWALTSAWLISLNSPLPALTGGDTTIDGTTQTELNGDTNIFGPEVQVDGTNLAPTVSIFDIVSDGNTIRGLSITRAPSAGVRLSNSAKENTIQDNYIGTDPAGVWAWGNDTGIEIVGGAHANTVTGCLISGNAGDGMRIEGSNTNNNLIEDSMIGLDSSGAVALPNGHHGIWIKDGPKYNVVWAGIGTQPDLRSIISGNAGHGVHISGSGSDDNLIVGNYIGTNSSGAWAVANGYSGVAVSGGAQSNIIQENVISGNSQHGVFLTGSGTDKNRVRLNLVGADAEVTQPLANGWHGVAIYDGAKANWVGTSSPQWGNVIIGSSWSGVAIVRSDLNTVMLNTIGTDPTGTATNLGNGAHGVSIEGIWNTIGPSNTIAYNGSDGIRVDGSFTTAKENRITRNSIYANTGKGIELIGNGNLERPSPIITEAACRQLEGSSALGSKLEIYSDTDDEGRNLDGTTTANIHPGIFHWWGHPRGPNVTATATDSRGNTSEFSAPRVLGCQRGYLPLVLRAVP